MPSPLTRRQKMMLAALAAESNASFAPVQVQKMFFLLDENIAGDMGGKLFSFEPYDYGPFDKAVYRELDSLSERGYVSVSRWGPSAGDRRYLLTAAGEAEGRSHFET